MSHALLIASDALLTNKDPVFALRPLRLQLTQSDKYKRESPVVADVARFEPRLVLQLLLVLDGDDDERSAFVPSGEVSDLARAFQHQRLAALVIREAARGVELRR